MTGTRYRTTGIALAVLAAAVTVLLYAPPLLPNTRLINEITIARPPQHVYDYVTTPANWPRWHPSSIAVRGATDHSLVLGESVIEDFVVAGRRGTVTWTVIAREVPARWSIEGKNATSRGGGTVTYTLRAADGGTRFTREFVYHMPNLLAAIINQLSLRERVAAESALAVSRLKVELEKSPAGNAHPPGR
jgi:uncharacterized protein YndB with AHSA1/START domain